MSAAPTVRQTALAATAALLAAAPLASPAFAAASISGDWRGNGTVKLESGNQERVRCKVTYGRIAGQNFSLKARCASSSGLLNQTGELRRIAPNRYVGDVHNAQFNVSARIVITVSGKRQSVSISSKEGTAKLQLSRR